MADPKIEEIASDSDDAPELEQVDASSGKKINRNEKKTRKIISKLNLKKLESCNRVTMKKGKNLMFAIQKPDVYEASPDSFVVFGEAKIDDLNAMNRMMQMQGGGARDPAAMKAQMEAMKAQMEAMSGGEESVATTVGAGSAAEGKSGDGPKESDIELVVSQGNCTREKAIEALKKTNNDIVEAIMQVSV